ncbi:hypothetical protein [Schinkia azotoformans]|uniref:hypothetical protein n=1 Tax=Schinkia azotoformans TaxID=1454 RepID=UPI002DBA090F|nr:hypothetical protein [Schinkia azotoformans]MEC1780074.1 hypothetical protein [Schinkia azotoformans]MED4330847.1 hypothetical protein [Schinkia azotoformans]
MSIKKTIHNSVDDIISQNKNKRKQAVEESLIMVLADGQLLCPVLSGTLKRSLTYEVKDTEEKTSGSVGTVVEYAPHVHLHTPFLEEAGDMNKENITRKLKEVLEE